MKNLTLTFVLALFVLGLTNASSILKVDPTGDDQGGGGELASLVGADGNNWLPKFPWGKKFFPKPTLDPEGDDQGNGNIV